MKTKYDQYNNLIYIEWENRDRVKNKYDNNNNCIYQECSDGYWEKLKYDSDNNCIYTEDSDGEIRYPEGKEYYKQYIRRKKIKRLLNETRI